MSEKFLIVVLYHLEGFKNFKYYYKYAVEIKYKSLFKEVTYYDRFIQIIPNLLLPLSILVEFLLGEARGIYFLDRTPVTELAKKLKGSIYADKGYIGAALTAYSLTKGKTKKLSISTYLIHS